MAYLIKKNRQAKFNYQIIQNFEAGISLLGWEVKSIRQKKVDLKSSFCTFKNNELFIINMQIENYMNVPGDINRTRKLLLTKSQLKKIYNMSEQKGMAIIPLDITINSKNFIKISIAIAKGKNLIDKREEIKKRDQERELNKTLKGM